MWIEFRGIDIAVPDVHHCPGNGLAGVDIDELEVEEQVDAVLALSYVVADELFLHV